MQSENGQPQTQPTESAARALALVGRRVPMPPGVVDARWTWTKARLKAIYLDALTDISPGEIAQAVGVDAKTFYRWRQHPDYKRYLAELVFSDGLADRVARTKTRKALAEKLAGKLAQKLDEPGAFVGEKLPALIKALEDLLTGLSADAVVYEKAAQAPRAPAARAEGLTIAERIARIADPVERENARRALLLMFQDYIGEPGAQAAQEPSAAQMSNKLDADGSNVLDATENAESAETESEPGGIPADLLEMAPEEPTTSGADLG